MIFFSILFTGEWKAFRISVAEEKGSSITLSDVNVTFTLFHRFDIIKKKSPKFSNFALEGCVSYYIVWESLAPVAIMTLWDTKDIHAILIINKHN